MTREDKDLLLRDLCARLPYGVKVYHPNYLEPQTLDTVFNFDAWQDGGIQCDVDDVGDRPCDMVLCKPYLRPLSSMTEEEKEELLNHVLGGEGVEYFHIAHDGSIDGNQEAEQDLYNLNLHWLNFGPLTTSSYIDWLNKKMFDYRGLIPKDLALSTEEFNPYKD